MVLLAGDDVGFVGDVSDHGRQPDRFVDPLPHDAPPPRDGLERHSFGRERHRPGNRLLGLELEDTLTPIDDL